MAKKTKKGEDVEMKDTSNAETNGTTAESDEAKEPTAEVSKEEQEKLVLEGTVLYGSFKPRLGMDGLTCVWESVGWRKRQLHSSPMSMSRFANVQNGSSKNHLEEELYSKN